MRKILIFAFTGLVLFAGSGCLKDSAYEDQKYGIQIKEVKGVSLGEAFNSPILLGLEALSTPQTITTAVHLEADAPIGQDIKVNLAYVPALVTAAGFTPLPTTDYTAPTSATISAGKMLQEFSITIPNASTLNPNLTYGIGIRIASVEGTGLTIASNLREVVIAFTLKNRWDGRYTVLKSQVVDPNRPTISSTPFSGLKVDIITTGANTNKMEWPDFAPPITGHPAPQVGTTTWTYFGNAQPRYVWNPADNTMTAVENALFGPPQNRTYQLIRGKYDPATKIIVAEYNMIQAGFSPVYHYDSLKYTGPRP